MIAKGRRVTVVAVTFTVVDVVTAVAIVVVAIVVGGCVSFKMRW
jgi:hypothetical protein